jgi:cytochrome-b5 reductase
MLRPPNLRRIPINPASIRLIDLRRPNFHPLFVRSFTRTPSPLAKWSPFTRKSPLSKPSTHGTDLPPRAQPPPSLRDTILTTDYLLRGLYRSLLIAVIVIPLLIIYEGPIKTNHIDGEYEAFTLLERREVAPGISHFTLKRKIPEKYWWVWYEKETPEPISLASRTPIVSVRIKNPSLEIQRSYTPLTVSPNEIHLLVKRYPGGELSRFLHILTPGVATVWVNQGRQEWFYEEEEWDHIVFVAGGTGITPAFQLALAALQRQKFRGEVDPHAKKTRFSVLAAARDVDSILLRDDFSLIGKVHGEGCLDVRYFVDSMPKGVELPGDIQPGPISEKVIRETIRPSKKGWFTSRETKLVVPKEEKVMILVCGPDGFTSYISGPHGGVAAKQGVKRGLLKNIEGVEVFKMLESREEDDASRHIRKRDKGIPVMKLDIK